MRERDDEDSDGGEAVGQSEPERPLPDFADQGEKEHQRDLADLVAGVDPGHLLRLEPESPLDVGEHGVQIRGYLKTFIN